MRVETSKGISNQNTSLRGISGPIEPGSACFSKLVETGESPSPDTLLLLPSGITLLGVENWVTKLADVA